MLYKFLTQFSTPSSSQYPVSGWVLGAGLLMGLTPAPYHLWPLAWVAIVPLWVAIHQQPMSYLRGLRLALLWSIGFHGFALSWITGLHPLTWLGIPWLGSIAIATFAWVFVTLWGAAQVGLWAWGLLALQRRVKLSAAGRVLIGTTLWCLLKALWNHTPLDWTTLAFTQSPYNLAILHLGQLAGPLTVAAAILAVNGLLAEALLASKQRWRWASWGLGICLLAHLLGGLLYLQPLADEPSNRIKIGILQGNIPTREKLTPQGIQRAREVYLTGYRQLARAGAEAVLTPEGALPTHWDRFTAENNPFYRAVQQEQVVLWLGTVLAAQADTNQSEFAINQSLLALIPKPDGQVMTGQYHKVKLVPLGEYIPLQSVLGNFITRLSPISTDMIPGEPHQVFNSGVGQAAVGICYDSVYSWLFQTQVAHGSEFILTASNNDPYPRRMMAQHHAQDVMRAIETDRWTARATNTGLSGIVNPHGQTIWLAEPQTYTPHLDTIYRRQTQTPYVRWGNWLTPLLGAISLAWIGVSHFFSSGNHLKN